MKSAVKCHNTKTASLLLFSFLLGCSSQHEPVVHQPTKKNEIKDISQIWQSINSNSAEGTNTPASIESISVIDGQLDALTTYTIDNSDALVSLYGRYRAVKLISIPQGTAEAHLYSYANSEYVFTPLYQLLDENFLPVGQETPSNWVEHGSINLTDYFYTHLNDAKALSSSAYLAVYANRDDIGNTYFMFDPEYQYHHDNGTDYPRNIMLKVTSTGFGVLGAQFYK